MSRTPQSTIVPRLTGAALTTGLGVIPLHRLPSVVRTAYVVLPAAAATGAVLAALRHAALRHAALRHAASDPVGTGAEPDAPRRERRRQAVRVALPVLVGGLTAGAGAASIVIDRAIENALRRHGVPAPRVVMGLGAGALSLAMDVLADRGGDGDPAVRGDGGPAGGGDEERADGGDERPTEGRAAPDRGAAPTSPPSAR